jgi:multiple sugar transport system permease protein
VSDGGATVVLARVRQRQRRARDGRWWRFALMVVVTALVLVPVAVPVYEAAVQSGPGLAGLARGFGGLVDGGSLVWLRNSVLVTCASVVLAVLVGAPAGYVLSRGRGRGVRTFGLAVFTMQALPAILLVVPLFVLFAALHLVDNLPGITLIYAGMTAAVAVWTMAASFDAVPIALEEAAWLDGCSVLRGFVRIVLPNALPGVLATVVFTFLFAWNEYLTAVVFLTTDTNWTIAIGVVAGRGALLDVAAMVPPLIVFALLNRFLRFGGLGNAVTG